MNTAMYNMSLMHVHFRLAILLAGMMGLGVKVIRRKKKRGLSKDEDQLEIK